LSFNFFLEKGIKNGTCRKKLKIEFQSKEGIGLFVHLNIFVLDLEPSPRFSALRRFGNNVFTFFSGVTFGLLIGGSVMFYYMDNKIQATQQAGTNEKNQMGLLSKFIEFAQKTNPFAKGKAEKDGLKEKEKGQVSEEEKGQVLVDSSAYFSKHQQDTVVLGPDDRLSDDGLVVKKDELLFSKFMEIVEINTSGNPADSLNSYGSRNKQIAGRMWVEFWRSPLNYRGYKFGRNKLVVYGITEYEGLKILKLKEDLFLKYNTSYFRIANSDDFVPFNKVIDELTLIELNQL
jgi:hypothetical protein